MPLAKKPNEKFNAVKEAYLEHIIPSIRLVYEKANKVRESFVLVHCAILSLSGFYAGAKDTNGATYRDYVSSFFPTGYSAERLWKDLRNSLIHSYIYPDSYIYTRAHASRNAPMSEKIEKRTYRRTRRPYFHKFRELFR